MAVSVRTISIISASVVAFSLVGFSYAISGTHPLFSLNTANAESTDALLKAYAAKDTDADGLPDWEESLYGTDPNNAHSVDKTLTDGQAVAQGLVKPKFASATAVASTTPTKLTAGMATPDPATGSLTDQFSQTFLQSYMQANGGQPLAQADKDALVTQLVSTFSEKSRALVVSSYTISDVRTTIAMTDAAYAAALEKILVANDVAPGTGDPVALIQAYVENNDATAQPKIQKIATSYRAIAKGLAQLSVPPSLASYHLTLMQAFDTLSKATSLVANYKQDPIAVMGALSIYQPASASFSKAMMDLSTTLTADGTIAPNAPGYLVILIGQAAQQNP